MEFTGEDRALLERHVTSLDSNIYVIRNLPPEVVAVLFAYVSRSPASFRENLLKLIKSKELGIGGVFSSSPDYGEAAEKAKKFHERWVVGYGHSSVAEHAVANVALEDVSILATKTIEDNRLASYTEKSTRYQVFDRGRYYKPKKIMGSKHSKLYQETCDHLFDTYTRLMPGMMAWVKRKYPRKAEENEALYESVSKARACDVLRYLLPASTLTSLGMTANARVLEHAIRKMLSSPLEELNSIGSSMKGEVRKVIPTLVKYADRNEYIFKTNQEMGKPLEKGISHDERNTVRLVHYDKEAEDKLVTAIMYRYSGEPYENVWRKVKGLGAKDRERVIDSFLKNRGQHDQPMRELEHAYYTYDILVDFGAFRDIQRHRMATQTNQRLTANHGYEMPGEVKEAGIESEFRACMERARRAFDAISRDFPEEAQYVVPLAFRKRVLFTWNLRELHHFVKLRSSREGHESYRRIAWQVLDELAGVQPLLARYIKADKSEGPSR